MPSRSALALQHGCRRRDVKQVGAILGDTIEDHVTPSEDIDVLLPLAVGAATTVGNIVIHGLALTTIIHFVRREERHGYAGVRFWKDVPIVAVATLVALIAHLLEIAVWALVFVRCGEFLEFPAAFCHSAGSYTTLGCGVEVMSARWRLLGPLEAADGMLMFGITTATIFVVIQRLVRSRFHVAGE